MGLKISFHVKLGFVPLVLPSPYIILNRFVIISLFLTSLLHFQLQLVQAALVDFELVLQVFDLLHFYFEVFLVRLLVLLNHFFFALKFFVNSDITSSFLSQLLQKGLVLSLEGSKALGILALG